MHLVGETVEQYYGRTVWWPHLQIGNIQNARYDMLHFLSSKFPNSHCHCLVIIPQVLPFTLPRPPTDHRQIDPWMKKVELPSVWRCQIVCANIFYRPVGTIQTLRKNEQRKYP
jgi:hypothetical protein